MSSPDSELIYLPLLAAALTTCFGSVAFLTNPRRGINQAIGLVGFWLTAMLLGGALSYISPGLFLDRAHHVAMGACLLSVVVLMHCVLDHPTSVIAVLRRRWWLVLFWIALVIPGFAPGVVLERGHGEGFSASFYYHFHLFAYVLMVIASLVAWSGARKRAKRWTVEEVILVRASVVGLGLILVLITAHVWVPRFTNEVTFIGHGMLVIGFCSYVVLSTSGVVLGMREIARVFGYGCAVFASSVLMSWAVLHVTNETSVAVQAGTLGTVFALIISAGALAIYSQQVNHANDRALLALASLFEKNPTAQALLSAAERVIADWARTSVRIAPPPTPEAMPPEAFAQLAEAKWTTPELLDRAGKEASPLGRYVNEHELGLIVAASMGDAHLVIELGRKPGVDQFGFNEAAMARFFALDLLNAVERIRVSELHRDRESNEFIEAMSATLAHQLRTPLNNVAALLHAYSLPGISSARLEETNFKIREDLKAAAVTLEKMMKLRTKRDPAMKDVAIIDFLHHVRATFREKMRSHRTHCTCEIPANLPPVVKTDEEAITTILEVFIENAMQAFPPEQAFRAITLAAAAEPRWVTITVSDNGPGIPAEAQSGLFRVMRSTKQRGAGFGLAGAMQSARSIGGTLECRSPGLLGGASMTLRIPRS